MGTEGVLGALEKGEDFKNGGRDEVLFLYRETRKGRKNKENDECYVLSQGKDTKEEDWRKEEGFGYVRTLIQRRDTKQRENREGGDEGLILFLY